MTSLYKSILIVIGTFTLISCNAPINTDGQDQVYNRIDLEASAVQRIDNDEMEALLFVEKTASNPKSLTTQINPIIKTALEKAKAYPDVKLATASQNTNPNYDYKTQKIQSWSMRSELRLISNNFAAAGELIGALQESGLQVASIDFKVSDSQRQKVENEMITQVTESFKQRAEVAKESWGAKDFKLVTLAIDSNTNMPAQPYYGDASYAAMESAAASEPAPIAGGEQRIEMVAKGVIELVK